MSYRISNQRMDEIITELQQEYRIYAPVRYEGQGRYSDTDVIDYAEIDSVEEIVSDEKSDFSPKEVLHPITQTLFYFTEDEFREKEVDDKDILLFARPCDINGIDRLDTIFLENGDIEDKYYKRLRDKLNFALLECPEEGWDTCFCTSMETNKTENYSLAARFKEDELLLEVNDDQFDDFFVGEEKEEFTYQFVTENELEVNIPKIDSQDLLEDVYELDMWDQYDDRCESCGACTASCITCSCFTTSDTTYTENGQAGERRRVWASCMHDDFTEMAGGHSFRDQPSDRMRFRTLHKVYDFKERFGEEHMCVGCGRCTDSCNELISFSATINRLNDAVEELKN